MLSLIITLIIIGIALWMINVYIPMDQKIKTILNIVVVIITIIYVCNAFGLIGSLGNLSVPRVN